MKTYEVVIQASITKTVTVEATDEDNAHEKAHEAFNCNDDGTEERYTQDTLNTTEVKK